MLYTSPFCQPFNSIGNSPFPFYYFPQQPLHPTTILISNTAPSQEPQKQKESLPQLIRTQNTLRDRTESPEPLAKPKKEGKAIKRESSKKKDENFGFRNQNKDRNMVSSILKGYVHFILNGRGMVKLIENLAKNRQIQNGVSAFYDYMSKLFPTKKTYVGLQYLLKVMRDPKESQEMRFILAVTLRHYFLEVYPLSLHQGSKLKKKLRLTLLKKVRSILGMLFQQ